MQHLQDLEPRRNTVDQFVLTSPELRRQIICLVQGYHRPLNSREDAIDFVRHVERVSQALVAEMAALQTDFGGLLAHLNFFNYWTLFRNYRHKIKQGSTLPNPCSQGAQFLLKYLVERVICSLEKFFTFSACSGVGVPKPLAHAIYALMNEMKRRCTGPWRNVGTGRRLIMSMAENVITCSNYLVRSGQMEPKCRAFCRLVFTYPSTSIIFSPLYKACNDMTVPIASLFQMDTSSPRRRHRTVSQIGQVRRKFCVSMLMDSFQQEWTDGQPEDLSDLLENPHEILASHLKMLSPLNVLQTQLAGDTAPPPNNSRPLSDESDDGSTPGDVAIDIPREGPFAAASTGSCKPITKTTSLQKESPDSSPSHNEDQDILLQSMLAANIDYVETTQSSTPKRKNNSHGRPLNKKIRGNSQEETAAAAANAMATAVEQLSAIETRAPPDDEDVKLLESILAELEESGIETCEPRDTEKPKRGEDDPKVNLEELLTPYAFDSTYTLHQLHLGDELFLS